MMPEISIAQKKASTPAKKTTTTPAKTSTPAKGKTTQKSKKSTPSKTRAEYERQQKALQQQIRETERMISNNDQSVRTQNRDIKLREEEMRRRKDLIRSMQLEIQAYIHEEDSMQVLIEQLTQNCIEKQAQYARAVQHMFRSRNGNDGLLFVLAASDLTESVRRMRYLREYSQWRHQEAEDLKQERQRVQEAREALVQMRQERQMLMGNVTREQESLAAKQQQQQKAVEELQRKGKELKAELERDQKQQREVQERIRQIIEEERRKAEETRKKAEAEARRKAKAEADRKAREAAARKSGSGGSSTTTPAKPSGSSSSKTSPTVAVDDSWTRLTGSFRQNKGKLPYPVDTNFAYLQHYSPQTTGNVSITLSAGVGAHACAVFEGTVSRVTRTSEEYIIIVLHGDYMSVYSNLGSVNVKEGQKVKTRDKLGQLKTDVSGRYSELQFWIYSKNDAMNPETWLRR